jgi:molybdenum cofactor cytidylyltransferase
MKFGLINIEDAEGAILAHSMRIGDLRLSKGMTISQTQIAALRDAGITQIMAAQLGNDDIDENNAAAKIGAALLADGFHASDPVAGRVNLIADQPGIVMLAPNAINQMNSVDEALTIATLPNHARVDKGALLATIKVIPYAAKRDSIHYMISKTDTQTFRLHPFVSQSVDLILTRTDRFKESLLTKAQKIITNRIAPLGLSLQNCVPVAHEMNAIANAINESKADIVLILGASATSDRQDVIPAAIEMANGRITRFGMPVDPGNLLVIGHRKTTPIVGLPGCARAPALNGVDWVLERLAAKISVGYKDIAHMGVGGLLKEIPQRIHPRAKTETANGPKIGLLLAAGASSRMLGDDKLLREIDGIALLRRSAQSMLSANFDQVYVSIKSNSPAHENALANLPVTIVHVPDAVAGMSASIRAGISAIPTDTSVIVLGLADMPDITAKHYNLILAAHDPKQDHLIIRPITPAGKHGNPVLFDARFMENLTAIAGDQGARDILKSVPEYIHHVKMTDEAVICDLDTPEAWDQWLSYENNLELRG